MSERDLREELAGHLRLFGQLGAEGLSREPAWRVRPADRPEASAPAANGDPAEMELVRADLGDHL